jgi:hypothetical protein
MSRSWALDVPLPEQTWRNRARCRVFYGLPWTDDATPPAETLAMMAGVCAGCPVQRECAQHILDNPELGGFWAGVWVPWWVVGDYPARRQQKENARAELRSRLAATSPLSERSQV